LNEQEKEFLQLYVLFYILNFDFCNKDIEREMLKKSEKFTQEYPESKFSSFIGKYTNHEYEKSPWGTGGFLSSGQIIPTGTLRNHFSNGIPVRFGLTLNYNRFNFSASFGGSIGREIKEELMYQKPWLQGDKFIYTNGELLFGYSFLDKKRIGVTPFVGISGIGISPYKKNEDDTYYDDVENIISNNPIKYGLNLDFRWGRSDCKSISIYGRGAGNDYVYGITTLSIGYNNPKFNETLLTLNGGLWFIEIGIAYKYQFKRKVKKRL
jgi:hypothetical protein